MNRNTAFSSRNWIVRQLSRSATRASADETRRRAEAEVQPGDHDREHARAVQHCAEQERRERGDQRSGSCRARRECRRERTDETTQPTAKPTRRPDDDRDHEVAGRSRAAMHDADDRGDRGVQRDERGRVVQQALALEDRHDAARQPEASGDRRHRDRVGRGDHRGERERGREGDRRDQRRKRRTRPRRR